MKGGGVYGASGLKEMKNMSDQKTIGERVDKVVNKVVEKVSESVERAEEEIAALKTSDSKRNDASVRLAVFCQSDGECEETVVVLDKGLAGGPEDEIHDKMRNAADKSRVAAPRKRGLKKKKSL
jgi:hypothetical protein